MPPIHGSCLCGGVEFEIAGPLTAPLNCHCSQCRRQHGAAFRSRVRVQAKDFRWLKGEHLVKFYESSRGYQRGFCGECGSPIINRNGPNFLEAAGGISEPRAAIRRRAGAARRSAGAAGAALLRRQQGAVVRDHRRPAAISGISAARIARGRAPGFRFTVSKGAEPSCPPPATIAAAAIAWLSRRALTPRGPLLRG